MEDDELKETKERFEDAAKNGATLGDGVRELKRMGKEHGMESDDVDDTLETMFRRAHGCARKKKERKQKEEGKDGPQKKRGEKKDDKLDMLLEATADDLPKKALECMGKSIKKGLKESGMPEGDADGVVEVLKEGAEEGKKVKEGVEYLKSLGEEHGLEKSDVEDVLHGMAKEAFECFDASSESEDNALAQMGSDDEESKGGATGDDESAGDESGDDESGDGKGKRGKGKGKGGDGCCPSCC